MSAPTPWGFGGSGAPDGEVWVWKSCDPDVEDGRLFSATPDVAERVVTAINAHDDLLDALESLEVTVSMDFGPNRTANLSNGAARARVAIAKARGGK